MRLKLQAFHHPCKQYGFEQESQSPKASKKAGEFSPEESSISNPYFIFVSFGALSKRNAFFWYFATQENALGISKGHVSHKKGSCRQSR